MQTTTQTQAQTVPHVSNGKLWTGRVLGALATVFLLFDGLMKVVQIAPVIEASARLGWAGTLMLPLGLVLIACTVLYAIPRTSVLGAILLTGYLGGATATHVRVGEGFLFCVGFGVLLWAALFLRDERLRALIPLRSDGAKRT